MRVAYVVSALFVAAAPFGCSALLGDFTAGSAPVGDDGGRADTAAPLPDAGDAGADATGPVDAGSDATPPSDAPTDVIEEPEAAPPLQLLSCSSPLSPTPKTILTIPAYDAGSGNDNFTIGSLFLEHLPGTNQARLAVSSSPPGGGQTQIFTIPEQGGGSVASIAFTGTQIQAERKTATATALFLNRFSSNDFALYAIADSDPGTNPGEVPVATIAAPPGQTNGDFRTNFVDVGASYFALASYSTTVAGQYGLASWTTTQAQWQPIPGGTQGLSVDGPLVADPSHAYEFLGPPGPGGGGGPTALYQYSFPLGDGGAPASREITTGTDTAATMAAVHTASGYSIVFVELTGAQSGNYRAGVVSQANLNTFVVDDLPSLSFKAPADDAGFFDTTPFGNNGGSTRWLSNGDFASIGAGGTGSGGNTGLNFYVGTASGQWIIQTAGTGHNLLPGAVVNSAAIDLVSAVSDLVFTFDLAWTEQLADGTALLYFNQLTCQL